ncbi:FRG domain-containing protein [Desulfoplanes formicivorans]|uniref:FRG domain-containing protein n=1 Tax=Desulfoplanes formicivorans TaxID=1592317 RepID=A0A194AJJ6_9BACT|nr:FRG domain-containing protein [Desulfoplanes formicivorans]GAU09493.1 hypothetical protein DPF_2220 [Desulfoplanes formicivorans]
MTTNSDNYITVQLNTAKMKKQQKRHGKHVLSFQEYIGMLLPFNVSNDNVIINQIGCITSGNEDDLFLVQTSENTYRMMPGPEFSPRLYRGQSEYYPNCKPSLFRDQYTYKDQIYWTIKRLDLFNLIKFHPAVNDIMMNWRFDGLQFDFNLQAIAQHYQYPTKMLDLTRSKKVAMFFATHDFSQGIDNPKAAVGNLAVLYTIDIAKMIKTRHKTTDMMPIGLDPFPRPFAQKAFGLELGKNENLEHFPGVYTEKFIVTEDLAQKYSDAVGGAISLFPKDPFEDLIDSLRQNKTVTYKSIELSIQNNLLPSELSYEDVKSIILNEGYKITNQPIQCPENDILKKTANEWRRRRDLYIKNIKYRGCSDPL